MFKLIECQAYVLKCEQWFFSYFSWQSESRKCTALRECYAFAAIQIWRRIVFSWWKMCSNCDTLCHSICGLWLPFPKCVCVCVIERVKREKRRNMFQLPLAFEYFVMFHRRYHQKLHCIWNGRCVYSLVPDEKKHAHSQLNWFSFWYGDFCVSCWSNKYGTNRISIFVGKPISLQLIEPNRCWLNTNIDDRYEISFEGKMIVSSITLSIACS